MNKAIGIAVVVAGALAIFFFAGSSSSEKDESSSGSATAGTSDTASARADEDPRSGRPGASVARPVRMSGSLAEPVAAPRTEREYVRDDGTVVRDHRSKAVSENYERRVTLPKSLSPVQPETLAAVRTTLRPAMRRCIAAHAADAPAGSKAQAVLTVSIQDEGLTVDKLELATEGLAKDEDLKACITEVMLGHQQLVSGAKDVAAHTMTFPYDLYDL